MKADTIQLMFKLIRTEFDALSWSLEHTYLTGKNLIKATIELDLIEEAKEMISDAKDYGYNYTNLLN
jgi:hypothetical protein